MQHLLLTVVRHKIGTRTIVLNHFRFAPSMAMVVIVSVEEVIGEA
jgi:hypothetical protein